MGFWTSLIRGLGGANDREAAYHAEADAVRAASRSDRLDPRFRQDMRQLATREGVVRIGAAVHDDQVPVILPRADVLGSGHALVLGGTGAGKTRVVGAVMKALLQTIAREPSSLGLWVVDHKSEMAELTVALIGELVDSLPSAQANRLLDQLVIVNPFSTTALVPFQILQAESGVAPEDVAFEVTTLVNRLGGAELGVKQDDLVYHLLLLGVLKQLSLPDVAHLLADPATLASAAAESPSEQVRAFFGGGTRLPAASLDGVRARLNRLLRLPSTRLMLGSSGAPSFHAMLGSKIVIVDVGSPPLGCEDLGRFWAGMFTLKVTRGVFQRRPAEARRPVAIFVDEWQEGLAAGGDVADHYERVLSMARSRGVSLWLVSQTLAGATRVSPSLPKVVATNTQLQLLFRSSSADAHAMSEMLPVTGRRPRPASAPWEAAPKSPFLSPREELDALVTEVTRLPNRVFYLWNRLRPYPAVLARAIDVDPQVAPMRPAETTRRLRDGALAIPIHELERRVRAGAAARPPQAGAEDGATEFTVAPRRPRRRR